jgi:hypothetical protein
VALATYRDLCIDAVDDARMQQFWAAALGLEPVPDDGGTLDLVGPTPQHRVWINKVPEPVTVKQRVHLDVNAATTQEVLDLGATLLDWGPLPWDVLADPEGGELCVFVPADGLGELPAYRLREVIVDSADAHTIAAWWAEVLGATLRPGDEDEATVSDAPGMPYALVFGNVPEPKTVKNRIHWDVESDDVQALLDAGATWLRGPDRDIRHHVLADPEGNEFCVMKPRK